MALQNYIATKYPENVNKLWKDLKKSKEVLSNKIRDTVSKTHKGYPPAPTDRKSDTVDKPLQFVSNLLVLKKHNVTKYAHNPSRCKKIMDKTLMCTDGQTYGFL